MVSSRSLLFLLGSAVLYILFQIANKAAIKLGADALALTAIGLLVNALTLLVIVVWKKRKIPALGKIPGATDLVIVGISSSFLAQLFLVTGIGMTSVTNANLILIMNGVFTALFSRSVNSEKLSRGFWKVVAVMLIGAALVTTHGQLAPPGIGDALIFLAALSFGVGNTYAKKAMRAGHQADFVTLARFAVGFAAIALPALIFGKPAELASSPGLLFLAIAGGVLFAVNVYLFYLAVEAEGAAIAAQVTLVIPLFAVAADYLFFSRLPDAAQIVGGGIILAGAYAFVRMKGAGNLVPAEERKKKAERDEKR